jgi:hypothetical protein
MKSIRIFISSPGDRLIRPHHLSSKQKKVKNEKTHL